MTFYVTFRTSSDYSDKFLVIEAKSYQEAHDRVEIEFELDYSFVWNEFQWKDYMGNTVDKRFNLTEMKYEDYSSKKREIK